MKKPLFVCENLPKSVSFCSILSHFLKLRTLTKIQLSVLTTRLKRSQRRSFTLNRASTSNAQTLTCLTLSQQPRFTLVIH